MSSCVLPVFLLGGMAVRVRRDLGFEPWGIGLAFAVFFAVGALASAPAGRLVDRSDPAWMLRAAVLASAATSLAISGLARSLTALLVLVGFAGAANAICHPAANLVILRALPEHSQGVGLAVKQSSIPGAALLAGVAVPALALTVGWRWAFVVAAMLSIVAAVTVPRQLGSARQTQLAANGAMPARTREGQRDLPREAMALLAVAAGVAATATSTLSSFLVSAAVDSGVAEGMAGLLLTASSIAGIVVRLLLGAHADRRRGRHLEVVGYLMAGGAVAFVGLAFGGPLAYLLAGPAAFCTAWAWQGLFNLAVVRANPARPAAATGITQSGIFVGGVVGPLLFGLVAAQSSYGMAWLVASGLSGLAAALVAATRAFSRNIR